MLTSLLAYFLFLVAGLCVGSFLNVVIDRLPSGRSILGRSEADCCGKTLSVGDLVPVLSFLVSRGHCRHCGGRLSLFYPFVEIFTALLTVVSFYLFPLPYSVFYAINIYFLIVYFFMDLKYGLVSLHLLAVNLSVILSFQGFLLLTGQFSASGFQFSILAATALSVFFIFLILITRGRGLGQGDVFLVFVFSLLVGFPQSLLMVFLSFIFGGLISALLLLMGQKKFGQTIPFGPFLVASTLVSIFRGQNLLDLYFKMLLK